MDLLASYDDEENTGENSVPDSPKVTNNTSNGSKMLENEWLSFEQMIAPGGVTGNTDPVKRSDFLVDGIVAYPGMKSACTESQSGLADFEQSSAKGNAANGPVPVEGPVTEKAAGDGPAADDDDAFFKLRKQVKERDRSSSSERSGSSHSSSGSSRSRSREKESPSPPHLSPVTSVKSHASEPPPDLTASEVPTEVEENTEAVKAEGSKVDERRKSGHRSKSRDRKRSRSKDRKRSHRSKHHSSSKSKRHRSRSRSRDRKRRSRDRHRRKNRKSSKDQPRRSKSRDRKDSTKSETKESGSSSKDRRNSDSKSENKTDSHSHRKRSHSRSRDRKDRKKDRKRSSSRHRSRSKDKKESGGKDRKRSRSKERKRSRSKDRKRSRSKDRKRSRSKERKRSKSRDRKRKHRSRSRSPQKNRDRHSRSRSRERLRSRSPVMGRKLTFKEQMRKDFITASKEMTKEKVEELSLPIKRPGEYLKPSDLLKGVKLTGGESVTPQMALIQTMAAMHKKAQELTGVEVPKYYNPAAVNPLKYAEQVQKRKLLWSKKTEEKDKNEQIETQWKSAVFSEDDGKTASKFRKLMGMKAGEAGTSADELSEEVQKLSEEQTRKQAELFQRLDQEYQFARMTTHTQRGVGLGFATTVIDPNHPSNPP